MLKNTFKSHNDLLLTGKEGQRHYIFINDFNTFMYSHTLHLGRKYFCRSYLQAFSTADILKRHVNDCFRTNGKKMIKIS